MTPDALLVLDAKYFPLERYTPSAGQAAASLGLVACGFLLTAGIARLGGSEEEG